VKALITDLTRMYDYHACAAGIDLDTGKRVRPVLLGRLNSRLLSSRGGPLDIGNVVDFGRCRPCGKPPEVEDVRFDQRGVRLLKPTAPADFTAMLAGSAADSLDVIGPALVRHGSALTTASGKGLRSLVILRAPEPPTITVNNGRLRFRWLDGVWLSVTDVRLYQYDLMTPDEAKLASLKLALRSAAEVYLSFGLGRPWQQPGDDQERHYLQLNNIHVPNWPDWRLRPEP
jgi:hypothetical protein